MRSNRALVAARTTPISRNCRRRCTPRVSAVRPDWDKARSEHNLRTIAEQVGERKHLRIVAKSCLACIYSKHRKGVAYAATHGVQLSDAAHARAVHAAGRLVARQTAQRCGATEFFTRLSQTRAAEFNPERQIQWLVDTPETLQTCTQFARRRANATAEY